MCEMNSDCYAEYVCTFGKCHEACKLAKDCLPGQLCVGGPGAGVCVLPEEEECGLNSDCGDLFCAIDNKCRSQCVTDHDCATATQMCVPSVTNADIKVCAEPADLDGGMLIPADSGARDGGTADAGSGDADAADAPLDTPVGDVAPEAGDGGGGDAPPTVTEKEPNESREQPNPYTAGSTVLGTIGSATDVDYYETIAPAADLAGGFYQASITDVGDGTIHVAVYASNHERFYQTQAANAGADLSFYWAAVPGEKYGIAMDRVDSSSTPFRYSLKIVYTKVDDVHEANDTSAAAKMIAVGAPVTAYFFAGFKGVAVTDEQYPDWFLVDLAAGMTTVKLANVPGNWRPQLDFIDSAGVAFADGRRIAMGAGQGFEFSFDVTAPGMYRASLKGYGSQSIAEAGRGMVPENFTKPYTLTISQP
jgi:hypothetical protein